MRIVTTPAELDERGVWWDKALGVLGINEWAISEGQLGYHDEITLTDDQAVALGLLSRASAKTEQQTCAHCGRPIDADSGYASIDMRPVCHPDKPDRPDCYRLVTAYGEHLGSRL